MTDTLKFTLADKTPMPKVEERGEWPEAMRRWAAAQHRFCKRSAPEIFEALARENDLKTIPRFGAVTAWIYSSKPQNLTTADLKSYVLTGTYKGKWPPKKKKTKQVKTAEQKMAAINECWRLIVEFNVTFKDLA